MALIKCKECGKEISENAVSCPNCGAKNKNNNEEASTGLKVICFLIPLIGIIIFAINITTRPKYAKQCLLASLLPTIIALIIVLVMIVGAGGMFVATTVNVSNTTSVESVEPDLYEIEKFNTRFETYGGSSVTGSKVKSLLDTIRNSNISEDSDRQVKLTGDIITKSDVNTAYKYSVEFKYENKLISEVIINKK